MSRTSSDLTPRWVDHVAVDRALAGRPVGRPLHHAERVEFARLVVAAGGGYNRIMAVLRCNTRVAAALIREAKGEPAVAVSP